MTSKEVFDKGMEKFKTFDVRSMLPALRALNQGAIEDVFNINGCLNYQWITCVVDVLKPKQLVELGGAMGVWDLMVLHTLPADSILYSITLPENGLEFSYIVDKYPNFVPIVGDDLDFSNWPKTADLSKTDLWYVDSLHNEEQLRKEFELYSPFFKKGAIILLDDIHLNEGMEKIWNELRGKYDSFDATDPLHYSGFGIITI